MLKTGVLKAQHIYMVKPAVKLAITFETNLFNHILCIMAIINNPKLEYIITGFKTLKHAPLILVNINPTFENAKLQ